MRIAIPLAGGKLAMQKLLEIDPEVRAILSSGYATDPAMTEFKNYGFRAVIKKPYRIDELTSVLNLVIRVEKE